VNQPKRAVFFDRDGVLNEARVKDGKPYPPDTLADFVIFADAPEVCTSLRDAGFLLVVVTNQPDIGRGTQAEEVVDAMHEELNKSLHLDAIYICPHSDEHACDCRKPKPGMIYMASEEHGINIAGSYLVGDRWRDVTCGNGAGCKTVFIDYGYDERLRDAPNATVRNLAEARDWILSDANL